MSASDSKYNPTSTNIASGRRLDSWKEIAVYLGRDVRTAIRWEHEKGLPIHRVPGGQRKAVFAYTHEVDAWLVNEEFSVVADPHRERFREERLGLDHSSDGSAAVASSSVLTPDPPSESEGQANDSVVRPWRHRRVALVAFGTFILVTLTITAFAVVFYVHEPRPPVKVDGSAQITHDGRTKEAQLRTDGMHVYFTEVVNGEHFIGVAPVNGGETQTVPTSLRNVALEDISPDGSELLVRSPVFRGNDDEVQMYVLPSLGGIARPLTQVKARSGVWIPDGSGIIYTANTAIWWTNANGTTTRKLFEAPGVPFNLSWRSIPRKLLFFVSRPGTQQVSVWEMDPDGGNARILLADRLDKFSIFKTTPDAKNLVVAARSDLTLSAGLYYFPIRAPWLHLDPVGFHKIDTGLSGVSDFTFSADSKRLFAVADASTTGELFRLEAKTHQFLPFMPGHSALDLAWSIDGRWICYVRYPDSTLWKSRADGSEPLQLTFPPVQAMLPRWSRDGKQIAYTAHIPGAPWRVSTIPAEGGSSQRLTASETEVGEGAPTWSPDGRYIIFGDVLCQTSVQCGVHQVDLQTRAVTTLPGSEGLRTARWSPDGHLVAALREQTMELLVYDFATQKWTRVAQPVSGDDVIWSRDSKYLYTFTRWTNDASVIRVRVADKKIERLASLAGLGQINGQAANWLGLDLDDAPLFFRNTVAQELFGLDVDTR